MLVPTIQGLAVKSRFVIVPTIQDLTVKSRFVIVPTIQDLTVKSVICVSSHNSRFNCKIRDLC